MFPLECDGQKVRQITFKVLPPLFKRFLQAFTVVRVIYKVGRADVDLYLMGGTLSEMHQRCTKCIAVLLVYEEKFRKEIKRSFNKTSPIRWRTLQPGNFPLNSLVVLEKMCFCLWCVHTPLPGGDYMNVIIVNVWNPNYEGKPTVLLVFQSPLSSFTVFVIPCGLQKMDDRKSHSWLELGGRVSSTRVRVQFIMVLTLASFSLTWVPLGLHLVLTSFLWWFSNQWASLSQYNPPLYIYVAWVISPPALVQRPCCSRVWCARKMVNKNPVYLL